jgi:hypothetical protein
MTEGNGMSSSDGESDREHKKMEYILLVLKFWDRQESFPFTGIAEKYAQRLEVERTECANFFSPLSELCARFRAEGMRLHLGKFPLNGDVYVVPKESTDTQNDCIMPRHLAIVPDMDPDLKRLIELNTRDTKE